MAVQLFIAQRRLAPDRGLGGAGSDAGAEVGVGKVPAVDLGAVDRVGAEGGPRDERGRDCAVVGAAGAGEGCDVETPVVRQDAEGESLVVWLGRARAVPTMAARMWRLDGIVLQVGFDVFLEAWRVCGEKGGRCPRPPV